MQQTWLLLLPQAGATGISFARTVVDSDAVGERVLVHAAPPTLEVTVGDADGDVVAPGEGLERGQTGPTSYLVVRGSTVELEDGWPTPEDVDRLVLLPGGETGVLTSRRPADDQSSWRWQVEFFNEK